MKNIKVIYPSDYFNKKEVDESFKEESECFKNNGFFVTTVDSKNIEPGDYIYRGWMLNEDEYLDLEKILEKNNSKLITNRSDYLKAHYLKNWYYELKDFTPKTIFCNINNLEDTLNKLNWNQYFVKDYIKSLTTSRGSIAKNKEEVIELINEIKKNKGITGGICLREVESFNNETELRYFSFNNKIISPNGEIPEIVKEINNRINLQFFSIDIIKDNSNNYRLVEIGDGQVSDLKSPWKIDDFVNGIKRSIKLNNKLKI